MRVSCPTFTDVKAECCTDEQSIKQSIAGKRENFSGPVNSLHRLIYEKWFWWILASSVCAFYKTMKQTDGEVGVYRENERKWKMFIKCFLLSAAWAVRVDNGDLEAGESRLGQNH